MEVAIPKIKILSGVAEEKTFTINQNTAVSIGFVVTLLGALLFNETRVVTLQNRLDQAEKRIIENNASIKEIQNGYVSRNELVNTLKVIDTRLENIEKNTVK